MKKSSVLFLVIALFCLPFGVVAQCPEIPFAPNPPTQCAGVLSANTPNVMFSGIWCLESPNVVINNLGFSTESGSIALFVKSGESLTVSTFSFNPGPTIRIVVMSGGTLTINANVTFPSNVTIQNYGTVNATTNLGVAGTLLNSSVGTLNVGGTFSTEAINAQVANEGKIITADFKITNGKSDGICLAGGSCLGTTTFTRNNVPNAVTFSTGTGPAVISVMNSAINFEQALTSSSSITICLAPSASTAGARWGSATVVANCTTGCKSSQAPLTDPNPAGSETICKYERPKGLSFQPATGGAGNYAYMWQSSIDTSIVNGWQDEQSNEYYEAYNDLSVNTFYRRRVSDGTDTAYSKIYKVIISSPDVGRITPGNDTTICTDLSLTLRYDEVVPAKTTLMWQSDGDGWLDQGEDGKSLTVSYPYDYARSYRLRVSPETGCPGYTNEVRVSFRGKFSQDLDNTIYSGGYLCGPRKPDDDLRGSFISSDADVYYRWESSNSINGPWSEVGSTVGYEEVPLGILRDTTYFRRIVRSDEACNSDTSDIATIGVGDSPDWIVTRADDADDAPCGTLRKAIYYANGHLNVVDTIQFNLPNQQNVIQLNGRIYVSEDLHVKGPGNDQLTIVNQSEGGGGPVFYYEPLRITPSDFRLEAMQGSVYEGLTFENSATAIYYNFSDLTVKNCVFRNNTSSESVPGGGGIHFDGVNLTIDSCKFVNNAGIFNPNQQFFGDSKGAAVYASSYRGQIKVSNSTFDNNKGRAQGSEMYLGAGNGIFLTGYQYKTKIESSTFSNNKGGSGAALATLASDGNTDGLNINNCTFTGNVSRSLGGAIYLDKGIDTLESVTIANNGADSVLIEGSLYDYPSGGGIVANLSKLTLKNTLIAGNHSTKSKEYYFDKCTVFSSGGNLFGKVDTSSFSSFIPDPKVDKFNNGLLDPLLSPLGNYGGPTQTFLLLPGSPALDAGVTSTLAFDQRGEQRKLGGSTDIGSSEQAGCAKPFVVTSTADDMSCGTLRFALFTANYKKGSDTITFDGALQNASIQLDSALTIVDGVNIKGRDVSLVAADGYNIFTSDCIDPQSFSHLRFTQSSHETLSAFHTRLPKGRLDFNNVTFEGNAATRGQAGALYAEVSALSLDSCHFLANHANAETYQSTKSGALTVIIGKDTGTAITIRNSQFLENTATVDQFKGSNGGGAYLRTSDATTQITVENSTFSRNTAQIGGGLYLSALGNQNTKITNCTFSENGTDFGGSGIYAEGALITIINSTIYKNYMLDTTRTGYYLGGGGLLLYFGTAQLKNTIAAQNTFIEGNDVWKNGEGPKLVSLGNNFLSDSITWRGAGQTKWLSSDILGDTAKLLDAKLGGLSYNGGITKNHSPLPGSPVIGKGDNSIQLAFDQRGKARPLNGPISIGSVEFDDKAPKVDAGKDSSLCDSVITLQGTPAPQGFRGYWSIENKKANGLIIADTTKPVTTAKLVAGTTTIFIWTLTDDAGTTASDEVQITRYALPEKSTIDTVREACGPNYTLKVTTIINSGNSFKWTRKGQLGNDTLVIVSARSDEGLGNTEVHTTVVANYKNGDNTLYLTTNSFHNCVARDSVTLPYYPNEKPSLGEDTTIYETSYQLTVVPVVRKNVPFGGSWEVIEGTSLLNDSTISNPIASQLSLNNNTFVYTANNFCKTKDTLVVKRLLPADSANAGADIETCTDTVTLAAIKTAANLSGVWRSKKTQVTFADSTKFDTEAYGLPSDSTLLYWVVKTGTQVKDVDSVWVVNNRPTKANAGIDKSTCNDIGTVIGNLPKANETASWSSNSQWLTITNQASNTANISISRVFLNKKIIPNELVWSIDKKGCVSRDTMIYYRSDTLLLVKKDTTIEIVAGRSKVFDIISNVEFAKINVIIVDSLGKANSVSAALKNNQQIEFKTNAKLLDTAIVNYKIQDSVCTVAEAKGTIIVIPTNTAPSYSSSKNIELADGKGKVLLTKSQLDINENIKRDSIAFYKSSSGIEATITQVNDSTFAFEMDYLNSNFSGIDYVQFRIVDDKGAESIITLMFNVPSKDQAPLVHNALSPNGDGKNDYVHIDNLKPGESNTFQVFNRWGDRVYDKDDYDNEKVYFNGSDLPDGTYYYVLEIKGKKPLYEGYIVIKR